VRVGSLSVITTMFLVYCKNNSEYSDFPAGLRIQRDSSLLCQSLLSCQSDSIAPGVPTDAAAGAESVCDVVCC
jgi:hypothetical protein